MERIRAFVALNLPVRVIDEVAALQRKLRAAAQEAEVRVAWVPPPNMHVTLKFLGEVPAESAYAVRDRLSAQFEDRPAWQVKVEGVGVFPDEGPPRVLWVGLQDEGQTAALAEEVDACLDELGFARDKRPFHAHLTLGRIKQGTAPFWQDLQDFEVGGCAPTEVVLYRSALQRQGAEYSALARVALNEKKST